ncbi:MAG: ABC transporter substrate-binding protein [Nocardioides sp.]|nr:ABC transporter substrate-binding protein [Nocardioides sp.]
MSLSTSLSGRRTTTLAVVSLFTLTSCGLVEGSEDDSGPAAQGYPVTVENCGAEVAFDREPENVVLLKSAAVPFLADLDALDRVGTRAGEYPREYYDDQTWEQLKEIPALTGKTDAGGHLQISKEVVIDREPDLVLGEVENLDRGTLKSVSIPLLEEPGLCEEGIDEPGFDDVFSQMEMYGDVFNRADEAQAATADLKQRLAGLESRADGENRTAAVLYPTIGGGVTYAYGTRSMAHPILEAAGFEDVFAEVDKRVFEVSLEELLSRDPDVLVLLHPGDEEKQVVDAVTDLPGAASLTAVRNDDVMPLLFNYAEPPTPLSVDGLEKVIDHFEETS